MLSTPNALLTLSASRTLFAPDCLLSDDIGTSLLQSRPIVLSGFLDSEFLQLLARIIDRSEYIAAPIKRVGLRLVESPALAGAALCMALERPEVLRKMELLLGDSALTSVEGIVTQFRAHSDDRLNWHDDQNDLRRRLAITISLSANSFEGGAFELRCSKTKELLFRHVHAKPGEALLFPIGRHLEHRVLPLTNGGPRTVFAGWFLGKAAAKVAV